jgi:hypothetical protein
LAETFKDAAAIAQERVSLEERLLGLQGDTAVLRERERAALDESNRALYDQIAALERRPPLPMPRRRPPRQPPAGRAGQGQR